MAFILGNMNEHQFMFPFGVCTYIFYRILKNVDFQSEFLFSILKITSLTQLITFRFSYFFCNSCSIVISFAWGDNQFDFHHHILRFTILQSSRKFITGVGTPDGLCTPDGICTHYSIFLVSNSMYSYSKASNGFRRYSS